MGFLKNLLKKEFFTGYFYVLDLETLKIYLQRACVFSQENKLESAATLYIYDSRGKHLLEVGNPYASVDNDIPGTGFIFSYDDYEFASLDSLYSQKLRFLPPYFKINLPDGDDAWLSEYKAKHPELKPEDY